MWLTLVHPSKPFDAMYTLFMAVFFQFGSCFVLSFIVFALVQYFLFFLSLFIFSSLLYTFISYRFFWCLAASCFADERFSAF